MDHSLVQWHIKLCFEQWLCHQTFQSKQRPLSGVLFVICVEILSNAIKRLKEIEGIQIDPDKSIKITQYADDGTVLVKRIRSVHRLFDLLQQFENCSGLRINQSKSEILWLGSLRQRKDSILKLKLSDEKVYALGVNISYDEELATKRNFFEKLPKLKKILNIWWSRDHIRKSKYSQNVGNI